MARTTLGAFVTPHDLARARLSTAPGVSRESVPPAVLPVAAADRLLSEAELAGLRQRARAVLSGVADQLKRLEEGGGR